MPNLVVETELYRLDASVDPALDYYWFAVVITVGLDEVPVDNALQEILRPWTWTLDQVDVFYAPDNLFLLGTRTHDRINLEPRPTADVHLTNLQVLLNRNHPPPALWAIPGGRTFSEAAPPWSGVLRNAATYPGDFPQWLNLVRYFRLPKDPVNTATAICAVPLFDAGLTIDPTTLLINFTNSPSAPAFDCSYDAGAGKPSTKLVQSAPAAGGKQGYYTADKRWAQLADDPITKAWLPDFPRVLMRSMSLCERLADLYPDSGRA